MTVTNAADLLGFQFDVNFDPARLAVEKIDLGPFWPVPAAAPAAGSGHDKCQQWPRRLRRFYPGHAGTAWRVGRRRVGHHHLEVVQPGEFQATLSRVQLAGAGGRALPGSDTPAPATLVALRPQAKATAQCPLFSPAPPQPRLQRLFLSQRKSRNTDLGYCGARRRDHCGNRPGAGKAPRLGFLLIFYPIAVSKKRSPVLAA